MNPVLNDLAAEAGVKWFDYQLEAFAGMAQQDAPLRACLYYKTGAGKTLTALVGVRQEGFDEALVIAPPATHDAWEKWGDRLGMNVRCMSHAMFRMAGTKLSRNQAVIVDEFHMLGGHKGKGWRKMDGLARGLMAPLLILSATPNYNDAERVYCIQHVLDPHSVKGGYLEFLYRECNTEQNPFGQEPLVDKDQPFRNHKDAASYLASLPYVYYLPDDLVYTIQDIHLPVFIEPAFEEFGYDRYSHRIMASQMEERHRRVFITMVDPNGYLNGEAWEVIEKLAGESSTPLLVFAAHSTVADALGKSLYDWKVKHAVVTGDTPTKKKAAYLDAFRDGVLDVLVGTASLATGPDGLDKVCDTMVILDDTDDDALRRQLIGRIMPRGSDSDASKKQVYRIVPDWA